MAIMERKINKNIFERKNNFLEIKSINKFGKFCGYASVFNIVDSYNDIILPTAFKNTIKSKNINSDIKMLWQHDQSKPIGYFEVIKEDSIGLYVEGQILLDIQQGREAYNLIKNKSVNGLSIGYTVKDFEYDTKNNTRIIKEIELFEISIVTFPANQYSNITYCKSKSLEQIICQKLDNLKNFLEINASK